MSSLRRHLIAAFAVTSALAAPGAAMGADEVGSDFVRAGDSPQDIHCTEQGGARVACTLILDEQDHTTVDLASGSIVTRWTAILRPGAQARLRVLRRNPGGTFTAVGESQAVTGEGNRQTYSTHLEVPRAPAGYTIGLDLLAGDAVARPDDAWSLGSIDPPLGAGATGTPDRAGYELMLAASAERDADEDGLGDDSEDPCVGCSTTGGGSNGGGANGGGSKSGAITASDLRIGAANLVDRRKRLITIDAYNLSGLKAKGTVTVRLGRFKPVTTRVTLKPRGVRYLTFKLGKGELAALTRSGGLSSTATLAFRAGGRRVAVKRSFKTLAGRRATRFDGTYRGPGPIVIVVERGVVVNVSTTLNTFCSRSNTFKPNSFRLPEDTGPLLLSPSGRFAAPGADGKGDTMRIEGRIKPGGTSKGYLSIFDGNFFVDSQGRAQNDTCIQAKNWEVRRTKS